MKAFVIFYAAFSLVICGTTAKPAKAFSANQYLNKYGYMGFFDGPPPKSAVENAIKNFQKFAGIPVTGAMDEATTAKLTGPRCGQKDLKTIPQRRKRFAIQGTSWKKMDLTYSVHGYPSQKISATDVKTTMKNSFKKWQDVSPLTFKALPDNDRNADIIINFYIGNHGDPIPFDGTNGTVAHGIYPMKDNKGLAGDIHFDDDEIWTINRERGTTDFSWTSLHEIGHSVGLDHAKSKSSIMWPWYEGFQELHEDDIKGIQTIYGPPPKPSSSTKPTICNNDNYDAVMYHKSTRNTYFFKGKYVWVMDEFKTGGNHELISEKWQGLEGDLDAAYTRDDGDTIFFKGNRFWRYRGYDKLEGPKDLSLYITNHRIAKLDRIDGVMIWQNRRTYFFRGNQYWRYNEERKTTDPDCPRSLEIWTNVKYPVDDVMTWKNGKTFFFHQEKFYVFINRLFRAKIKPNQAKQRISYFIKSCRD